MSVASRLDAIRARLRQGAYTADVAFLLEVLDAERSRAAALEARLDRERAELGAVRYVARIINFDDLHGEHAGG